jgi:peptidoglycan/xylan/chitin deacetylase (PgdA/CDA1 family)
VPRLWLVVLIIVVAATVLAARTLGRPTRVEPTPVQTTRVVPTVKPTVPPAAAPIAARPTPRPTTPPGAPAAPTAGATHVTLIATRATVHTGATATATTAPPTAAPIEHSTPVPPMTTASAGSVALTFDAGADRGYAEDILDILQEQHVIASFGITGAWARANPDLVRRMAADGHLVFNHTFDHRSFTGTSDSLGGLSATARRAELDEADAVIAPLIGHSTRPFYRLPYGDDDARVATDVAPDGYTRKIGWTVDSLGWRGIQSADILARCLKLAAPGAVYVFHVGHASQDALALPQVIRALREKGFVFQRVDQTSLLASPLA